MKKLIFTFTGLFLLSGIFGQITFDHTYPSGKNLALTKFHVSGYKYTQVDILNSKIYVYNTNHSLFKTITIPALTNQILYVSYISENLFDLDNQIEYALVTSSTPTVASKFYLFEENGTQIMFKDSASLSVSFSSALQNSDGIYYDGTNVKMRLTVGSNPQNTRAEIYTLPGNIPCSVCSSGTVTGLQKNGNSEEVDALFYPNPVTDQLKLRYNLPQDAKQATIKITDIQGKLIEEFQVTSTFDFIYLPSNYNNGLYLYSLVVDGKTLKTEKILLNK